MNDNDVLTVKITRKEWTLLFSAIWFAKNDGFIKDEEAETFASLDRKLVESWESWHAKD